MDEDEYVWRIMMRTQESYLYDVDEVPLFSGEHRTVRQCRPFPLKYYRHSHRSNECLYRLAGEW